MKSQPEIQAENHKKQMKKVWASRAWKDAKKTFLRANPICSICGNKSQVPHHPDRTMYTDATTYIASVPYCIPMCNRCHRAYDKGLTLCPKCREHYTANDTCWSCLPEEDKLKLKQIKLKWNQLKKQWRQDQYRKWKDETVRENKRTYREV